MTEGLPARARIVIIGGGVGGASVAYHLAERGETDVVLLDRDELTSGSTFHSAGLVGQLRADPTLTRMNMYSVGLYRSLAETGWAECGGLRLACTKERLEEIRRQIGWARTFGLPLAEISAAEAKGLFPLMSTEGVLGAAYLPTDGYIDPARLTYALAKGARARGVRIHTHTRVQSIGVTNGRISTIHTDKGTIEAEIAVNCGGMFAAEIGRMAGTRVPIVPMSHQYVITEPVRERGGTRLPTLRDPDHLVYFREEVDGLLMGGYERNSAPWEDIPPDFNGKLLKEDWDRFEEIAENSRRRVPLMADAGIRTLLNGPEAFTPDNEFCLGETEVANMFVAAGFCAHGIAGAGGVGMVMAGWILDGDPGMDVHHMDIRRFGAQYRSPSYTRKRTVENYETYYDIPYPGRQREAGRPLRVSPAYHQHIERRAVFGEKAGWERVDYYEDNAPHGDPAERPDGWAGHRWSPAIGAEHRATRNAAGLFDESSFAKIEVTGPGAAALLNRLCDNDVAREVGAVTYTQCLNARGGIECDFTVTRTGEDAFLIVTGTAFGSHDMAWIKRHAPRGVRVADVTGLYACIALWGPRSRAILTGLTPADLTNEGFPYMTSQEITVGDVPARALRVTFVGELGWELYCPAEYGAALWNTVAGIDGVTPAGYQAIDSLRLEKGYRVWGADIGPDRSPYEAGLKFCVRPGKPGGFLGQEALETAPAEKLRCLTLADPGAVCIGNEPVRLNGVVAGRVTSGGYGYTVGRSIAYAYLPVDRAKIGTAVEVELFGTWVAGTVAREPLYDPKGERVRG